MIVCYAHDLGEVSLRIKFVDADDGGDDDGY
jgi:hypothetical protein